MIITLPKIVKALKISDYAPESKEEIEVWVNPPVKLLQEHDEICTRRNEVLFELFKLAAEEKKKVEEAAGIEDKPKQEKPEGIPALSPEEVKEKRKKLEEELDKLGKKFIPIFSELWSQGKEETHYTIENIKDLIKGTKESDPLFWSWLTDKSISMIVDHRNQAKKG